MISPLKYIPITPKQAQKNFFYLEGRTHELSKFRHRNLNYLIVGKERALTNIDKKLLKMVEKWKEQQPKI